MVLICHANHLPTTVGSFLIPGCARRFWHAGRCPTAFIPQLLLAWASIAHAYLLTHRRSNTLFELSTKKWVEGARPPQLQQQGAGLAPGARA